MKKWIYILSFLVIGIYGFLYYEITTHPVKYEELLNTITKDIEPKKEVASSSQKTSEDPPQKSSTAANVSTTEEKQQHSQQISTEPNTPETAPADDIDTEETEENLDDKTSLNDKEISEEERIAWEEQYRKNLEHDKKEVEELQRQKREENDNTVEGELPPGAKVIQVGSPEYFESFAREYVRSLSSSKWNNYYPKFVSSDGRYAEVNVTVKDIAPNSLAFVYRVLLDIQGTKPIGISANRIQ